MAKDRIVLDADRLGYFLAWYFPEEGDIGATLGESEYTEEQLARAKPNDWEHVKATITASRTDGVERCGSDGYRWQSKTKAQAALRAINAAIKDRASKPWPDWAVKAKAAGWKAPENWKP